MRFDRRLLLALAIPILVIGTAVARNLKGNSGSSAICQAGGIGQTAVTAADAYAQTCGYTVTDGGTQTGGQSGYPEVERFRVSDQGQIILVLVGRHTADGNWQVFDLQSLG